jgi:putative effector of murein hydrolase LrgA (UPF0299 family)
MVTTFLVLFLVPAMIGVQGDIGALKNRIWAGRVEAAKAR